eukprot:3362005-Amphidinium_carterae.1
MVLVVGTVFSATGPGFASIAFGSFVGVSLNTTEQSALSRPPTCLAQIGTSSVKKGKTPESLNPEIPQNSPKQ